MRKLLVIGLALSVTLLAFSGPAPAEAAKKPRAYIFFSQYCLSCKTKAPVVKRWAKRKLRGWRVRGIGYHETTREARRFGKRVGFRFPVKGDPHGKRAARLHVYSPTAIVLIKKSGNRRVLNYENW